MNKKEVLQFLLESQQRREAKNIQAKTKSQFYHDFVEHGLVDLLEGSHDLQPGPENHEYNKFVEGRTLQVMLT